MKQTLKTETLKIYNALLSKNPDRLQQIAGHTHRIQKNISIYEYLAIPTFVRLGKTIDAGY
jgi:hypothetical protein